MSAASMATAGEGRSGSSAGWGGTAMGLGCRGDHGQPVSLQPTLGEGATETPRSQP